MKYCLGQVLKSKQDYLELIEASEDYDLIELWVDFIEDFDLGFLSELIEKLGPRLLVLFRRNDGQNIKLALERRKEIIDLLVDSSVLLDLDIAAQPEEIEYVQSLAKKPNLLISYHNFDETPSDEELISLLKQMREVSSLSKFATLCQTEKDALRLLNFYQANKDENLIVLGMGEHALLTRLAGLIWAYPITYAPKSTEHFVAPGQLSKGQCDELKKLLGF